MPFGSVGSLFLVIALILAFLVATGIAAIPNGIAWVLFALTLGLLLDRVPLSRER